MAELICEELAHAAGFTASVGNWISPNGDLISGDEGQHHLETLLQYVHRDEAPENGLHWMNECVELGFIRLVFRHDVMFQIGAYAVDDLWGNKPNYQRMRDVLNGLTEHTDVDIYIFSRAFYVIGSAESILNRRMDRLEVRNNR